MATRCNIAIEDEVNGTVLGRGRQVYCHWDGYPAGVGKTLLNNYQTVEKVEALVALGDLSSVHAEVAPPEGVKHSYDDRADGVTVAYHRDRGEPLRAAEVMTPRCCEEFLYVWRPAREGVVGGWWLGSNRYSLRPLTEATCRD